MNMSIATLSQEQYLADRKREMRCHRGMARARLASARAEYTIRATTQTRATLVRCMANLFIADAFCDALEVIR